MKEFDAEGAARGCSCGHSITLHGRRGYGGCRAGRGGSLAAMVSVVRAGVVSGASQERIQEGLEVAQSVKPCACTRFHVTEVPPPETRECEGCGERKPIGEMATVFWLGCETYQCEQCRGGP